MTEQVVRPVAAKLRMRGGMVAARETTLQELLEGSKQYQVPLYQRTYSWQKEQLVRLWEDILQLAEDRVATPGLTHFIGSLVLAPSPANGPAGVMEFLVVDGQQRLTTLSLLLCAIRDHRAQTEDPTHRERINEQYLINRWKPEQHRLKLLPTQADRASYLACLDATPQAGGADPVGVAYRFFRAQLESNDAPDDPADLERIEDAIISGLALVSVTAQRGDNAHRIFESLNNTGLRLTQGDLLRNYLFMRLPTRGAAVYQALWLPLQSLLSSAELEQLFWLDLIQRDPRIKQTDTYTAQQARLDRLTSEKDIEAEITRFVRLGGLLKTLLDPGREAHSDVRLRLERLNAWGTTTVYPLLLHLLDRRDQGSASSDEIARAMLYVESFFVRRLVIGRATSNINRILLPVVREMDRAKPVDAGVRSYLSTGRKYYASDAEIRAAASGIPFYLNGRPGQRALILRWLDESYGSKEPVEYDSLTIEHVLPQTLTPVWRRALSDDLSGNETIAELHSSLVHTLGNLTLTGYNSTMSNSPFAKKREQLHKSGLAMNQEIALEHKWGRPEIHARASQLAKQIAAIWPGPVDVRPEDASDAWDIMGKALAGIPAGSWTTYGDLAALIGSHPVAVGTWLATYPLANAHRVLQAEGTVSSSFRWPDPSRIDNPMDLLRAEGVSFDEHGRADQAQRLTLEDLAQLAGLTVGDLPETVPAPSGGQDPDLRDRFLEQLASQHEPDTVKGVLSVLDSWVAMGGTLLYGKAGQTSCFLIARDKTHPDGNIWPFALYPLHSCEVVFQHLARRPPFDDIQMREELRERLNKIPGVDLPASKIALRPAFPLTVFADPAGFELVIEVLGWFHHEATCQDSVIDFGT
jgi:alkylated DNA nucleotide flippase Atl1